LRQRRREPLSRSSFTPGTPCLNDVIIGPPTAGACGRARRGLTLPSFTHRLNSLPAHRRRPCPRVLDYCCPCNSVVQNVALLEPRTIPTYPVALVPSEDHSTDMQIGSELYESLRSRAERAQQRAPP
jgi:hypothetical protein